MKKLLLPLLFITSFAWAVDEEQPAEEALAPATDTAVPTTTATQESQPQQPQLIQNTQKFDDWAVSCFYEKKDDLPTTQGILRNCQTAHIFQTADQKQIMRMYMVYEQNGGNIMDRPSILFHVPASVFLQPLITVKIDENDNISVPYNFCDQGGCYGGGPMTDMLINQFKKGGKTKVEFFDNRRQPITLDFSLKGFTSAIDYLAEQTKDYGKAVEIPQS